MMIPIEKAVNHSIRDQLTNSAGLHTPEEKFVNRVQHLADALVHQRYGHLTEAEQEQKAHEIAQQNERQAAENRRQKAEIEQLVI